MSEKELPPAYTGQPQPAGYPMVPPAGNYGPPQPQTQYWNPGGPPQQATTSHTTVIVNQPVGGGGPAGSQRLWTTGICGCFEDCAICLCGTFCGICMACQLSSDMGEFACLPCCVPAWFIALRTKWRTQENIAGSICDDCIVDFCCGPCAMCQLAREVKKKKMGILYNSQ